MKKYKLLLDDFIVLNEVKVFRIQALRTFGDIKKGELGGYVQKEENLSHDKNSWISEDAKAFGNSRIFENAWIYGTSQAFENCRIFGDTKIFGNAEIFGDALIFGKTRIHGDTKIYKDKE